MKDFRNYFDETEEYPCNIALHPLPLGMEYLYVTTTFLNGFINYVKPIKAFVLGRYRTWDEQLEHTISVQEPPGSRNWVQRECKSKNELFDALTVPEAVMHVKLDVDFQDDVLILARAGKIDDQVCYYFFWFDRDCSDSCIGRFITEDPESEVIASFTQYINGTLKEDANEHGAREIPLHYFKGWLEG